MDHTPFVTNILRKIASRIDAKIIVEPEFRYVGLIEFKSGKTAFFRNQIFNINPLASVEMSKDKHYANYFMKQFGFSVPEELTFFSEKLNAKLAKQRFIAQAMEFANKIGYPVIVKPNALSKGSFVTKVHNDDELNDAALRIFSKVDVALVQRFYSKSDYRIVVLDSRVISAYQRIPLAIIGNGRSTIRSLIEQKQSQFDAVGRDTIIEVDDYRVCNNLKRIGMSMDAVPKSGAPIQLLDNSNLSTGGDVIDVADSIDQRYVSLAVDVTRKMNLRLCGVDILASDISHYDKEHIILEINGAPGLDNYSTIGQNQENLVEELYLEVLKAIEKQ